MTRNTIPIEECDPLCAPRPARELVERTGLAGGLLSNTPPATLHTTQPRHYTGTDTLVLSYGVRFAEQAFEQWAEHLDALKAEAASGATPALKIDDHEAVIRPTGAKLGSGRGPLMAWQLEVSGCVFQFMRKHEPFGETPNVRVQVGALACLGLGGVQQIDAFCRSFIEATGGKVIFDKVSRWDPFTDLEGVDVTEFVDAVRNERIVTRSRNRSEFGIYAQGKTATGISLGAGITFRAYDKVHELNRDPVKRQAWADRQWGGNAPEQCTRCEFELKRDDLKSLGVDTIADLVEKGANVVRYLTHDWLRIAGHDVDARHTERVVASSTWQRVQQAFEQWAPSTESVTRITQRHGLDVDHLMRMIRGCIESVAVIRGEPIDGFDDLAGYLSDAMYEHQSAFGPPRYAAKLRLFEAAIPQAVFHAA